MTMESRPAIDGEQRSPRAGGEFETSKESRKKRRKERRADRERAHERAHAALEPLTIWVRTDPNRLQRPEQSTKEIAEKPKAETREKPMPKVEAKPHHKEAKTDQHKVEVKAEAKPARQERAQVEEVKAVALTPKDEEVVSIPEPETPKPTAQKQEEVVTASMQEMPVFQDLPQLEIRPRHFYTEPEVRQPGTTEIEHDILPPLNGASEYEAAEEPSEANQEAVPSEKMQSPAARLQELAAQKARRAEELEQKNAEEEPDVPEAQLVTPRAEMNEHVRAMTSERYEASISIELDKLLDVAESVRVEGVSVAEMFRVERIDEEGLRRIISDFLRGQRIEGVVTDEILRQQMRFERDPQLRQVPLTATQSAPTSQMQPVRGQQRKVLSAKTMRHQADRIADRLAEGIDRTVEAAENNPNIFKTLGTIVAVVAYFVVLILIIRS